MNIGDRIRERRKFKKITQVELASLINRTPQVISNWERGYTPVIPHEDVLELAIALETTPNYLLGHTNNPSTMSVSEEAPQYTVKTPDIDSIYQAKTLAEAIIRIEKMRREFSLSKEWMYEMWDKAIEVYGQPEREGGIAAHGPPYPGSGALDGGDEPR